MSTTTSRESPSDTARILHVDDEEPFVEMTAEFLERYGDGFEVVVETDPERVPGRLERVDIDCVVSDYQMPGWDGLELLKTIREDHPNLPFILFTGKGSEEIASDAISAGVTDYLQKESSPDQYEVLAARISNAVEHQRVEERARTFLQSAPDGIVIVDREGRIRETNAQLRAIFGYEEGELVGEPIEILVPEEDRDAHVAYRKEYVETPERRPMGADLDLLGRRKDGERIPIDISLSPMQVGERVEVMAAVRDMTERERLRSRAAHEAELTDRILETSPVGILVRNATDGTVTRTNQRAREILPEEGLDEGAPPLDEWDVRDEAGDPVHPDDLLFERVLEMGESIENEILSIETDDGRRWIRANASPMVENEVDAVVYAFEDITEQIELERERRERLDRITDAFLAVDDEWRITYLNAKAADLLERERADLVEANLWDQFPEAVETPFYEAYERAMESQETVELEAFYEPLETWFSVRAYPSETGLSVYFRDITERKERERRYEAIFNQTFQFTGLMEPDGTLIEANETAREFGGVDRDEVVGKKVWDTYWFQHGNAAEQARAAIERAREGELVRAEIEVQGADRIAVIDFSVKPVTDEQGNVVLLVPEGRDITELKQREQELRQQNERLDEFASIVSHDLRSPVSVARGNLELARDSEDDEAYLDRADDALDRMEELIEDLLTLARKGQVVSDTERVAVDEVAERAWRTVETPEATLDAGDVTVEADADRLRELLENLFRNSVEHGGEAVTVTVGAMDDGFYVADDGAGIPPADRDAVFDSGYTTGDGETGFGLAIVESIAEAHGWRVAVTESEAGGARFEFST